ncbi:phage late control D family protein, partial [Paraburkholderia sp. J94]|uniref:phage late control D family protein n=1 Tax=Paraburkholderia sp. J94 TaxID=2805441 RepID=UPI002AB132F1
SDYQLDVQTIDESGLYLDGLHKVVDTDKLIGQSLTVRIAVEGNGTLADGEINIGAGVREITGVISEMKCLGADNRRMQYRLRLRCFLWLATLNRENRHFRDMSVVDISKEILKKYTFKVQWDNVIGAGNGRRPYPKRDYQRQFWQSDWDYLNLLWQEWGLCFYWENDTLVMMDTHGYPAQEPAYKTVRYLERGGQRIDEEHIHKLEYGRGLTTGVVRVMDYDYTMADVNW